MKPPKNPLWHSKPWSVFDQPPDPAVGDDGGGGGGGGGGGDLGHWSDSHDTITANADVHKLVQRYATEADLAKAHYEARQKLSGSFRLPDDLSTLTEEQRGELHSRMNSLKTVPENAEGYEIERPQEMPDGLDYDETFEAALRDFAHQRGWENKDVQEVADFFNTGVMAAHNRLTEAQAKASAQAENEFKLMCGPHFKEKIKGVGTALAHISEELGLSYTDKQGNSRSKLLDCFDAIETGQSPDTSFEIKQIGNKIPVLQAFSWVYEKFLREAEPIGGSAAEAAAADFFSYANVDRD